MPLKIALVGAGHMGKIHIEKLASLPDSQIVGIVDVDLEKARILAQKYHVPFYGSHDELMDQLDAAVIATPTETHYQIGKDFLEAGIHVLVEKPIASTQEEAKTLIEIAKRKKLVLQVGFLERFNPAFMKSLPMIKKPLFIESHRMSGYTGRSTDIDVVLDLMIHDIDLILSIVQEDVYDIKAQGVSFVMDKLDVASARLEFSNGCIVNLNANRISAKKERTIAIFEKNQSFFVDLMNRKVAITLKKNGGDIEIEDCLVDQFDAVKHELSAFIQSIIERTRAVVNGEDGLKALTIADRIKQYIAESKVK
jgi:predicted dehydrogenase